MVKIVKNGEKWSILPHFVKPFYSYLFLLTFFFAIVMGFYMVAKSIFLPIFLYFITIYGVII